MINAFQASMDRLVRRAGDGQTVTLRRRHTLATGTTGTPLSALAMAGAALIGATTINLDAANLVGTLPAGCVLTIAAAPYTTQASVTVAGGVLTGVTISPGLAGAVADNAAVTITQPYGVHTFTASRGRLTQEEIDADGSQLLGAGRLLHLSAVGSDTTPAVGDVLVDGTSEQAVRGVRERKPGGTVAGWVVEVGDAS